MKPAAPVMTMRRLLFTVYRLPFRVCCLPCKDAAEERHPHDLEVERHRPVLDVIEIEFDALFERGIAAPPVDLRPAGDARLDLMAQHVLREPVLELIDEERPLRARADNR